MTARRVLRIAPVLLAALTGLARADDSTAEILIATEGRFPPFNSLDADGQPQGFEIDLGNAICFRAALRCSWAVRDWLALIPGLKAGEFDVIMAGMAITPGRKRNVDFTREYFPGGESPQGVFVGTHTFQSPEGARIAVQKDTIHEDHLRDAGYDIVTFATADAALAAVLDGTAELVFGSPDFLENLVFRTSRSLAIVGQVEIDAGGAAAAVAKGNTNLRQSFDAALDALEADGTIEELRQKWFTQTRDI